MGPTELIRVASFMAMTATFTVRRTRAAQAKGCRIQLGTDMLFEMIPAYLEFFGFGSATPEELRAVAQLDY